MSFDDEFEEMNRMLYQNWGKLARISPLMSPSLERAIEKYGRYRALRISETDKEIVARIEIPGLNKEDIVVNLTEDRLELSIDRHKEERNEEGKKYVYKERYSESYHQSVSLPGKIDVDKATASYNNGILEINMPRKVLIKRMQLKIE